MTDKDETRAAILEARELKRQAEETRRRRAVQMLRDGVAVVDIERALRICGSTVKRLAREAGLP